jgi:ATP synthase subunit 6
MSIYFFSPLENFSVLPLIPIQVFFLDLSITNLTVTLFLVVFFTLFFFLSTIKTSSSSIFVIPTRNQSVIELLYSFLLSMVITNIKTKSAQSFFPVIFTVFFSVASLNLIGLVPYCFTPTSSFMFTFVLSISTFIGINIISAKKHGWRFFSLFFPKGVPLALAIFFVPAEFFLHIFKPCSLAIRLACNIFAGHLLLKILAGFSWSLLNASGFLFYIYFVPLIIILILLCLEFAVAFIQAYVFSLLLCVYISDILTHPSENH